MQVFFSDYNGNDLGVVTLVGDDAHPSTPALMDLLATAKVFDPADNERELEPSDGEAYLLALPFNFQGVGVSARLDITG